MTDNETGPEEKSIVAKGKKGGFKTYNVEKITSHNLIKKKKYYLVKWLGFKEMTWEPAKQLKEDVPEHVKEYEDSIKL